MNYRKHRAKGHSVKTVILFILIFTSASLALSQSVLSQFSSPNQLDIKITTKRGNLKLHSDNMIASYTSATRCFTLRLPIHQLEAMDESGSDRRLLRQFKKERETKANLDMSVCSGESSIGLDKLEMNGEYLPVNINFGDYSFQNEAQVWSQISGDNILLRIMISNRFNEPVRLLGRRKLSIKLIELSSARIQIYNFRDHAN